MKLEGGVQKREKKDKAFLKHLLESTSNYQSENNSPNPKCNEANTKDHKEKKGQRSPSPLTNSYVVNSFSPHRGS